MEKICNFNKRDILLRIKPDPRIVIYFEVQYFFKKYRPNPDETLWTIIKVFDEKNNILSGKYELPLYT